MAKRRKKKKRASKPRVERAKVDPSEASEVAGSEETARKPAPVEPARPAFGNRRWLAYAGLAALCLAVFGRGLGFGLLDGWDDDRFLLNDPLVQEVSLANLASIFGQPHFEAYHPLHLLSYWLDVPWLGLDGPGLHAVNVLLWVLAGIAALEAAWALGLGFWGGLTATALVLVHPVQVEAVTWVTGRKDILALGFSALAVWLHCRSARPFDRWRFASVVAFAAAGLSKTTALPLPLVMIAADVWVRRRDARTALVAQAPALVIAAGLGAVTLLIWRDAEMIRGRELELGQHVGLVGATLSHFLATIAWPGSLSPLYPIDRGAGFGAFGALLGPVVLAGAIAFAWRRQHRGLLFATVAFALLWLPASNIVPLYFQWQDRYLSLPLWPLALGIGLAVDALSKEGWIPRAAAAALVLALGARTVQYVGVWRNTLTLFGHAASTHPSSFYAWLNLGHARVKADQLATAAAAYERAVENQNLVLGHAALFRAVLLRDEREQDISPSQADARSGQLAQAIEDPEALRGLALELAEAGYRRAVMLALDYSFAIAPLPDDTLERAALVQIQRGNEWLARYYVSRLSRTPIHPVLQDMYVLPEEDPMSAPE